jgi:hypothetical protein
MGSQQQATIRFKAEGLQEVSKSFEQLSRQAVAQTVQMNKYAGQGRVDKAIEAEKRLAATTTEIREKATLTPLAFAEKRMNESYQKRMLLVKGNLEAEAAITQAHEAKLQQLQQSPSGGGGKMAGALSGFGGKMILGHAAGIAAGDILGDQHGGRELGSIVGAAMFGGPMTVAAVAGMELIGTAFRTHRENLLAAQKAGQDYSNTLMSLASTWSGFATGLVERNSFGKAMEGEFNRALAAAEKFQQERDVLDTQTRGVMSFGETIDKILLNETPGSEIARKNAERQADIEMDTAKEAEKFRDTSYEKQKERQADELKNRKTWYSVLEGMRPGRQKEELELSAKHSMDYEKRKNKEAQDEEMAEAGIKRAQNISDKANELQKDMQAQWDKEGSPNAAIARDAADRAAAIAQLKLDEAIKAPARIKDQYERGEREHQLEYEKQNAAEKIKTIMQLEAQTEKTAETQAKAKERGYAGEEAALRLHYDYELKLAKAQSPEMVKAVQDQLDAEKQIRERAAHEQIQAGIAGVHTPAGRAAAMDIYNREMAEASAKGASPEEQVALKEKLLGLDQLRVQTANEQIQLDYENYKITAQQADIKRMEAASQFKDNPEVQAAIKVMAAKKEELAMDQDIRHYRMEGMGIQIQYDEKRHMLSQRDADVERMILADRRAQEKGPEGDRIRKEIIALADAKQALRMAEITHVGMFSSAYAPGRVNFGALNQNRPYGALQGPGQFSGGYTSAANVTGLNKDFAPGGDNAQKQTALQQELVNLMRQIAQNGGLN